MSILYVSDLDGTLLRRNEKTSEYTNNVINSLTEKGMLFLMPLNASKAKAIKQLQSLLKCEKLVAFGDGKNDIDMFELADESFAVQNAHEDLKRIATGIISSNDEDGNKREYSNFCKNSKNCSYDRREKIDSSQFH